MAMFNLRLILRRPLKHGRSVPILCNGALILAVIGCAGNHSYRGSNPPATEYSSRIILGETTRRQAMAALGQPDSVSSSRESGELWQWRKRDYLPRKIVDTVLTVQFTNGVAAAQDVRQH